MAGLLALWSVNGCSSSGEGESEAEDEQVASAVLEASAPVCLSIERGVFGSVVDTQIASEQPSANYGTKSVANVGKVGAGFRQTLLRFDLSPIPFGAILASASLTVNGWQYSFGASATVRAHRVLVPWDETIVSWSSFQGAFAAAVEAAAQSRSYGYTAPIPLNVTALVQAWVGGVYPNQGLLLEQAESTQTGLSTSEAGDASLRPRLEVCYLPPTCSDGVKNGDETAIDCGGSCACSDGFGGVALVAGGGVAHSLNYSGVFSLGQSPGGNGIARSPNYRFHGGLIGATQGQ
jgi:hypothetical protein